MSRPTIDQWALQLAQVTAKRSTCFRRQVGCVLLNERGHVVATGYNGVAAGMPHCNHINVVDRADKRAELPNLCDGARAASGTDLDRCQAIHAEQNALLQCSDVYDVYTAYVTTSPCITCCKLLLNTSCKRIVFMEEYPHDTARNLWESSGRVWLSIYKM